MAILICYQNGYGVTKNYKEARRLYALASAQVVAQASERLKELDELIRTECPLLGKRVIITGTSRKDLNGKAGVATDFDHAKGRYVVTLNGKDGKVVKLKPGNVRRRK